MRNLKTIAGAAAFVVATSLAGTALAVIQFDQFVTPNTPELIFGSGNANGGFTTDRANNVEIGLRGKIRFDEFGMPQNIFNSNGDGTYSFQNIVGPGQAPETAEWSFEWTVNTDTNGMTGQNIDALTYEIGMDGDPGLSTDFLIFDPINVPFADHSFGDNMTLGGEGVEANNVAEYAGLITNNNVVQQSWRYNFFNDGVFLGGPLNDFDPTDSGTYAIYLLAKNSNGDILARSDIQILVGNAMPAGPKVTCVGFEPPLDEDVSVDKPNRVLPLRIVLVDGDGVPLAGDVAAPVLQVSFTGAGGGMAMPASLESVGKGDDGNMFSYGDDKWAFNMKTKGMAKGVYEITAVSGDLSEYVIDPTCTVSVEII